MAAADCAVLLLTEKPGSQPVGRWVYTVLKHNIVALHLKPGQTLTEAGIAELLHTSRTPVRESFIKLAEDGVLKVSSQRGWRVALIDVEQAEEARFMRRVLDKAVLREACRGFPEPSLFDLTGNLQMQKLCKAEANYERMFDLDEEFHRLIYRGCRKEGIWAHQKKMDYNLDRLRMLRLTSEFSWDPIIDEHSEMLDLVRSGDEARAEEIVDRHLTRSVFDALVLQHGEFFVGRGLPTVAGRTEGPESGKTAESGAQPANAVT